ncbi:MAG: hypothetical protein K2K89_02150 [Ruminococcus sp.]|nr:hypothetical protein [Ruminococcus sp.]
MNRQELSERDVMLKKCQKIYSFIFLIYAMICIPYACGNLLYGFFQGLASMNVMPAVFKALSGLAVFAVGLASVYKKEPKFTWFPVIVTVIPLLVSGNFVFLIISLFSAFILSPVHKKYRWLETQEGFPYFNELLEEHKNSLSEAENKSKMLRQKNIEIYKNASGKMDEI